MDREMKDKQLKGIKHRIEKAMNALNCPHPDSSVVHLSGVLLSLLFIIYYLLFIIIIIIYYLLFIYFYVLLFFSVFIIFYWLNFKMNKLK